MTTPIFGGHPTRARGAFLTAMTMAAVALMTWSQTSAIGHNVVLETSPEAGSTVSDSPIDIRVVTSDQLLDLAGTGSGFAIVVRDAAGLYYGDGCVTIGDTDMSATVDMGQAGDYTVTFQFVSADGHSLSDSFQFTYDPSSTHVPAVGFEQAPQCGVEPILPTTEGDETVVTTMEAAPDGVLADTIDEDTISEEEPERGPITLAIAGVLVVLSITLLVWMVRRRNGS
jgi:copper resistance protein C